MRNANSTTVAPDVLHAIARLSALRVPGVHGTAARNTGRSSDEGVHVDVSGDLVDVDLFLILEKDVNLRQVSREVQADVARAISDMVGMKAGRINIHIEDIYFPSEV